MGFKSGFPRVLLINRSDGRGGASKLVLNLHAGLREKGYLSEVVVEMKSTQRSDVIRLPSEEKLSQWNNFWRNTQLLLERNNESIPGLWQFSQLLNWVKKPRETLKRFSGKETGSKLQTRYLLEHVAPGYDIIHAHNLHGGYFDLSYLPQMSRSSRFFITLHDAWLLSGHCVHSFECERWKTGCGKCPDLTIPVAIRKDSSSDNWQYKHNIFRQCRLNVATPCQWLMDKVNQSMLAEGIVDAKVIPNGINLNVFKPGDSRVARAKLDLPQDIPILLFSANGLINKRWKNLDLLKAAARILNSLSDRPVLFICLGQNGDEMIWGNVRMQFVPYQAEEEKVALYYQAATIYLHPAKADTFPTSVLEALACGKPVIASAVGGIPEQVRSLTQTSRSVSYSVEKATGILVEGEDPGDFGNAISALLSGQVLIQELSNNAWQDSVARFDDRRMTMEYLCFYEDALNTNEALTY
jgi:glycosyltransferase involved in cell wall biosynthesis